MSEAMEDDDIPVTGADNDPAAHDGAEIVSLRRTGAPLDEAAENAEPEALFEVVGGAEPRGLGKLVKPGTPIEMRVKMTGKSVPGTKGGLIDPYATSVMLMADCVIDDNDVQYIRNGDGEVEKAIVYMTLKPRNVADARSEQGRTWIREIAAEADAAA